MSIERSVMIKVPRPLDASAFCSSIKCRTQFVSEDRDRCVYQQITSTYRIREVLGICMRRTHRPVRVRPLILLQAVLYIPRKYLTKIFRVRLLVLSRLLSPREVRPPSSRALGRGWCFANGVIRFEWAEWWMVRRHVVADIREFVEGYANICYLCEESKSSSRPCGEDKDVVEREPCDVSCRKSGRWK